MTAKEKVLAAEPRARHWGNTEGLYVIGFKDGDRFVQLGQLQESIEAAWQNAAESLPAQPEQELCPYCRETKDKCLSNEYCYSTHWEVAPVEATHNPPTEELFDRIAQRKQALVDSSSISSEQTFEEWWGNTGNQIFGADAKDAAFAAWNAAKGQSNGRS